MKFRLTSLAAALLMSCTIASAQQWAPAGDHIRTPWADQVSPANAHPEYPRPQLYRPQWRSLNGLWDYSICPKGQVGPEKLDGKILVPFAVESSLSGVGRTVTANDAIWYHTTFSVPSDWKNKRVMLNFEAVDWQTSVYVNDILVGTHTGGYTHFSFDITPYLKKSGQQKLIVKVLDATDNDFQPRGKQVANPSGIWYTAVSGIWQSVWIEAVPATRVTDYFAVADIDNGTVDVTVDAVGLKEGDLISIGLTDGEIGYSTDRGVNRSLISTTLAAPGQTVTIAVPYMKLWSPDKPYLYGLELGIVRDGKEIDHVKGYTAMRKISSVRDKQNNLRMALNNQPLFQFGPLDQGWWPDGLYTAPTDEAMKFDIQKTKDLGFNMIRKHIKIEPSRWFYYCDQLGMMVWQDMPSFGVHKNGAWGVKQYNEGKDFPATPQAKANYYKEWSEIMAQVKKFQCIVVWVPFNEAWSQFDTEKVIDFTREQDNTRLINMASGGNWVPKCGDILDNHHYPFPKIRLWDIDMINVLGEYGGIGLPLEGHLWQPDKNWGYVQYKNSTEVTDEYVNYARMLEELVKQGCSAAVYTQTTDVEIEVNGFMTYDRKVLKMDEKRVREANQAVIRAMK